MKENKTNYLSVILCTLILVSSCKTFHFQAPQKSGFVFEENFNNQSKFSSDWEDDSFKSPKSYSLEDEKLKITTRKDSKDRVKVKTKKRIFGAGSYEWRIFVPKYGLNEQCSIGAFIYYYKKGEIEYELDFEIGSGSKAHRSGLNAKPDEMIVHCTSQYSPNNSERFTIKANEWHNFTLELIAIKNKYVAKWYINNVLVKTLKTDIETKVKFSVHNSLENLTFMGNHLPKKDNYVLFDSFNFQEYK